MDDPHTKAFLLFQAHYECADLPIADYVNDTKSVLEQAPRVVNAMVDIASDLGLMDAALTTMEISQVWTKALFFDKCLSCNDRHDTFIV